VLHFKYTSANITSSCLYTGAIALKCTMFNLHSAWQINALLFMSISCMESWDSSVWRAYKLEDQDQDSIPDRSREFPLHCSVQTCSAAHLASSGVELYLHSPYVFMVWCMIKHSGNIVLALLVLQTADQRFSASTNKLFCPDHGVIFLWHTFLVHILVTRRQSMFGKHSYEHKYT
jgi:hypothetical protein